MMNIIVTGGDGFCGWPLSLRLSKNDNNVLILDNLSRRNIDTELGTNSLTPIKSIQERLRVWKEVAGKDIQFENIDLSIEYDRLKKIVGDFKPSVIIHLGEQRAAPYSMKNEYTRNYTVNNNLNATHNLLNTIVEVDRNIHFIHLGTMGVYGYGTIENTVLPEGYINVKMQNADGEYQDKEILHPAYGGSIYHLTKTQDALFFQFYNKNYDIKITDLHQGIIWGMFTPETMLHESLINRFDYDSDYGTVLNRFIMQSATDIPLTIYGTGEQTRAFININNFIDCILLSIDNPPEPGERVIIRNQMTETHRLIDIANLIQKIFPKTQINYIDNPRKELVKNDLRVCNKQFLDLGLKPIYLDEENIRKIYGYIIDHKSNINMDNILPKSFW